MHLDFYGYSKDKDHTKNFLNISANERQEYDKPMSEKLMFLRFKSQSKCALARTNVKGLKFFNSRNIVVDINQGKIC